MVGFEYGYDRGRYTHAFDLIAAAGNRLFERNTVSTGSNPDVDSLFDFDQLNLMTDFDSGLLNTGGTAIASPKLEQSFTLDETGNYTDVLLRESGSTTLDQAR